MSEKVKVSQDVANALKDLFSRSEINYPKDEILEMHYKALNGGDRWCGGSWEHINKLSMSEMAQAMFVGYETVPQFVVGELVKVRIRTTEKNADIFGDVTKVTDEFIWVNWEEEGSPSGVPRSCVKEVTLEEAKEYRERRLWKSIGREVGEFKIGDVRIMTSSPRIVTQPFLAKNEYEQGELQGFYPVESFIKF